jgi:hypothetical protein
MLITSVSVMPSSNPPAQRWNMLPQNVSARDAYEKEHDDSQRRSAKTLAYRR